jgi:hypothetical protein
VLSSTVFANPHLRPRILIFLPRALAPGSGSYYTNYLGSPHPGRAFCGPRAEIPLRGFTLNFGLSTLDLVAFRPSRGLCELRIKNSPPLRPNRPAPPAIGGWPANEVLILLPSNSSRRCGAFTPQHRQNTEGAPGSVFEPGSWVGSCIWRPREARGQTRPFLIFVPRRLTPLYCRSTLNFDHFLQNT